MARASLKRRTRPQYAAFLPYTACPWPWIFCVCAGRGGDGGSVGRSGVRIGADGGALGGDVGAAFAAFVADEAAHRLAGTAGSSCDVLAAVAHRTGARVRQAAAPAHASRDAAAVPTALRTGATAAASPPVAAVTPRATRQNAGACEARRTPRRREERGRRGRRRALRQGRRAPRRCGRLGRAARRG